MQPDRTTKLLLGLIAAGLWTVLLRPLWTASPTQAKPAAPAAPPARMSPAQAPGGAATPALTVSQEPDGTDVYVAEGGRIYRFDRALGRPRAAGVYGPDVKVQPDPTVGP
ncbi:MAG: hypothetical protein K0Q72_102 [Armatimonadetes bacterium]|nr:hypothetical protein [Armatimonadota bacterium]